MTRFLEPFEMMDYPIALASHEGAEIGSIKATRNDDDQAAPGVQPESDGVAARRYRDTVR